MNQELESGNSAAISAEELAFRQSLAEGFEDDALLESETSGAADSFDGGESVKTVTEKNTEGDGDDAAAAASDSGDDDAGSEGDQDDPWEGVPAPIKNMLSNIQNTVESLGGTIQQIDGRLKQSETRLGGVINEFYAAKKAAEDAGTASPTKQQMEDAAKSSEKWKALKEEYPEWGEAIDERLSIIEANARRPAGMDQASVDAAITKALEENPGLDEKAVQLSLLSFFQPDWHKKRVSKEYAEWLKTQPPEIIAKTQTPYAADAVYVLDEFDTFMGNSKSAAEIAEERKARLKGGEGPKTKKAVIPKNETDLTEAEFRERAAKEVFAEE